MSDQEGDELTYRPQSVDYLGFLEAQLRDMQGIAAMAYELIQNADDIKDEAGRPANHLISFDVRDDALIIENEGVFRPVDFERLQHIASGAKRAEPDTSGAFGIGFLSVFQVTDYPEIFSSGYHWTIRADAEPERRIEERRLATQATRFRLPWAFDESSPVRRRLRLETVQQVQLDQLAQEIGQAIEMAALFLRQIHTLEVKRQGQLLKKLRRHSQSQHQLQLEDETGQRRSWYLLQGDFEADAAQLRDAYPYQIEAGRRCQVRLAIPAAGLDQPGRLFAMLPTETTIPLPLHINADFFPTTDRKRISFLDGYQEQWNQAAMSAAAHALAANLAALPPWMGHRPFWRLLERMDHARQLAEEAALPPVFARFWQAAAPHLSRLPLIYQASRFWSLPSLARLPQGKAAQAAEDILESLAIPLVHPDLLPFAGLMRRPEIDVPRLGLDDLLGALAQAGLDRPRPLAEAPPLLADLEGWRRLWPLIDRLLLDRPADITQSSLAPLNQVCLLLTQAGRLERPGTVYRGRPEAQRLFPQLSWLHQDIEDNSFPGTAAIDFGVSQAVAVLAQTPLDELETAWRSGRLDLAALFRWFESQQIEIFSDDPSLSERILRLPLAPVDGELHPLRDLFLPGDFDDPLRLSSMVDLEALGGRAQFLGDLGVSRLDFDTYLRQILPQVLRQRPDLPTDARHQLVQLLAGRLGQLRDDAELQQQLSLLPLIACFDGHFRPASQVYASRQVLDILGQQTHIAEPTAGPAQQALHQWLGVAERPRPADLIARVRRLAQMPPQEPARSQMTHLLSYLAENWPHFSMEERQLYASLRHLPWLPARADFSAWHPPHTLHTPDQAPLIASQARFLDVVPPLPAGTALPNGLFHFLQLPTQPAVALVAAHLATCSRQGIPADDAVYQFLDAHAADPALATLRQLASVPLPGGRYVRPDQVYWQPHPFGPLRHQLPAGQRVYERLLKRLGVRQRPQAWDYIQVLREISQQAGASALPLNEAVLATTWTCWRHLGQLLSQGVLDIEELAPLQGLAALPDSQGELRQALELFFNDDPALAQKFAGLAPFLLPVDDPSRPALQAVGVRPLTQAVQVELVDVREEEADPLLSQRLRQRRPLLERVLASAPAAPDGGLTLAALVDLPVKRLATIHLRYRLQRGSQQLAGQLETVAVTFAGHPLTLYVAGPPGTYPWAALARVLANALRSGGNGGLASGIKEALAGESVAEAARILDDLGYPRLSQ